MNITITGWRNVEQVFENIQDDLENLDAYLAGGVVDDLRDIVADNYQDVWSSKGAAINSNWNGNTLVKSGRLRNSLTNPNQLQVRQAGGLISFGTSVPYGKYVNAMYRFEGLTSEAIGQIDDLVEEFLDTRTKANWR